MKEKIKEIYEASCFKMDPVFVLAFDKNKYYDDLNKQKLILKQTNYSKRYLFIYIFLLPVFIGTVSYTFFKYYSWSQIKII